MQWSIVEIQPDLNSIILHWLRIYIVQNVFQKIISALFPIVVQHHIYVHPTHHITLDQHNIIHFCILIMYCIQKLKPENIICYYHFINQSINRNETIAKIFCYIVIDIYNVPIQHTWSTGTFDMTCTQNFVEHKPTVHDGWYKESSEQCRVW